ncbi:MAG: hypothetical protein GY729_16415 [Desulfobacteraceae bacterium]|nr:hypothetical protein [Desulfobacteraceae bacterium]
MKANKTNRLENKIMKWCRLVVISLTGLWFISGTAGAVDLELYDNFHTLGVIVTLESGEDPDENAAVQVEYRETGGAWKTSFPLTRTEDVRFVGTLFFLEPGTLYDVRVSFSDPGGILDGTILDATRSTRSDIAVPQTNASLYVAPDGSGTECSPSSPCALLQGVSQAQPGDEVVLTSGVYYEGDIDIPRSGSLSAPIVIRGDQTGSAIVDGSDPATFLWSDAGQGVYHTTVNISGTHLVTADGRRLFPYNDLSTLETLSHEVPGFYADGFDLYVHLENGDDPNNYDISVSRFNLAFMVEKDYIYFQNIHFRYFGTGSCSKVLYLNNANNILVENCKFEVNDLGVGLKRASNRNVIQNNEFFDTIFEWPWSPTKTISKLESGAIRFYDPTNGRGNIIRNNTFHDYFDGFGVAPMSTTVVTNETDVYGNLAYNIGDDGVEVDGRASNVRLWDNVFHDVLMGISLAPVYDGPVYVIRNLIYRTGAANSDYSGSPFKFNSGYAKSGTMYLFHNTCSAELPGNNGIYIKAPGTWENIVSRNNIFAGTSYAINNYNTSQPVDLDYDALFTSYPNEFVYWGGGSSSHMRDLATFQNETLQELNGLNENPEFIDSSAANYQLSSSSLLINAGVVLPGINDGYSGLKPDIGAFETNEDCATDLDQDQDVDGKDLALFAINPDLDCITAFVQVFGQ